MLGVRASSQAVVSNFLKASLADAVTQETIVGCITLAEPSPGRERPLPSPVGFSLSINNAISCDLLFKWRSSLYFVMLLVPLQML